MPILHCLATPRSQCRTQISHYSNRTWSLKCSSFFCLFAYSNNTVLTNIDIVARMFRARPSKCRSCQGGHLSSIYQMSVCLSMHRDRPWRMSECFKGEYYLYNIGWSNRDADTLLTLCRVSSRTTLRFRRSLSWHQVNELWTHNNICVMFQPRRPDVNYLFTSMFGKVSKQMWWIPNSS